MCEIHHCVVSLSISEVEYRDTSLERNLEAALKGACFDSQPHPQISFQTYMCMEVLVQEVESYLDSYM